MVDSLFQGQSGNATHQAIMSSDEYMSQAQRNFNNLEDGYYISPSFLDKVRVASPAARSEPASAAPASPVHLLSSVINVSPTSMVMRRCHDHAHCSLSGDVICLEVPRAPACFDRPQPSLLTAA